MKVVTNVSAEGPGKKRKVKVTRHTQGAQSRNPYYDPYPDKKPGEDGLEWEHKKRLWDQGRAAWEKDKDRAVPDYGRSGERRLNRIEKRSKKK